MLAAQYRLTETVTTTEMHSERGWFR